MLIQFIATKQMYSFIKILFIIFMLKKLSTKLSMSSMYLFFSRYLETYFVWDLIVLHISHEFPFMLIQFIATKQMYSFIKILFIIFMLKKLSTKLSMSSMYLFFSRYLESYFEWDLIVLHISHEFPFMLIQFIATKQMYSFIKILFIIFMLKKL